jgi:hypothetical protein
LTGGLNHWGQDVMLHSSRHGQRGVTKYTHTKTERERERESYDDGAVALGEDIS